MTANLSASNLNLINELRASAEFMPRDSKIALTYRAAADALTTQATEIERLHAEIARLGTNQAPGQNLPKTVAHQSPAGGRDVDHPV